MLLHVFAGLRENDLQHTQVVCEFGSLSVLAQDRPDSGAMKCCPDVRSVSKIGQPSPQQHEELQAPSSLHRSSTEITTSGLNCIIQFCCDRWKLMEDDSSADIKSAGNTYKLS